MSLDWITVAAQIANFLVLVWLLRRFLYQPILDGIDKREAEIAARMGEAQRIRETAEEKRAQTENRIAMLESEQSDVLATVRAEAEAARDSMISEAHEQMAAERAALLHERREQAERYAASLQKQAGEALLALVRKALIDLADETLEERIVAMAARRLDNSRDELAEVAGKMSDLVVTTRDALPEATRLKLTEDVRRRLAGALLRFETNPDQAPGLVLRIGDVQVAWTTDSYVDALATMIGDQFAPGARGKVATDAA